ncbi:MAG TPA: L-threonylcarbamoyladenylate synthase [Candidatus Saccharimonadales bacterium]|nr:L-threonylcarbamoyladenylate synthase [Candidatus Saccharimonadales bacterium]
MAKVLYSLEEISLVELLLSGAIGVVPTDTVYGLVARASDPKAVAQLYHAKHRVHKPGTIIAADITQLLTLGIEYRYLVAAEQFWPGPVSVETPHAIGYLHQGTGRQALRIPDDENVRGLLAKTGALQTTSANAPGYPPATTLAEAQAYFGDVVDFYVDGGDLSGRKPSTIVRCDEHGLLEIIRRGAVDISDIKKRSA